MKRQHGILARAHAEPRRYVERLRTLQMGEQTVDHHVPDANDRVGRATLGDEIAIGVGRGCEKQVNDGVGHDAIHFLRHRPIARAQARLDMCTVDPHLGAYDSGGHGAVHIADNQNSARTLDREEVFETHHRGAGLRGVRTGTNTQIDDGTRHSQVLEEDLRHRFIIVLPGMNESVGNLRSLESVVDRCSLHEVRACADDGVDHVGQPIAGSE